MYTSAGWPGVGPKGGYPRIVKLLSAVERGAWRTRREMKERGDAAMAVLDYRKAVECYEQALGAVLQVRATICR